MAELFLFATSVGAGFLGSLLGLGGGIILVPVLTLAMNVHIRYAIAASLISIIATSSGAAAGFLKDHLTNVRLAVFLEVGTVAGAIAGFLISKYIDASSLFLLFGAFLFFSAVMMLRQRTDSTGNVDHPWSEKLALAGRYQNEKREWSEYKIEQLPLGLGVMFVAGILSALLGIGSGIFKVMAMDRAMKLPMKVSSATSNFMIGVTASASAGAYFLQGDILPQIAAPLSLGVLVGSWIGARAMVRMPASWIRRIFVVVLAITSIQMILRGVRT